MLTSLRNLYALFQLKLYTMGIIKDIRIGGFEIVKYLDDHKEGKADNSRKIWTIYMFLVWYEEYFVKR